VVLWAKDRQVAGVRGLGNKSQVAAFICIEAMYRSESAQIVKKEKHDGNFPASVVLSTEDPDVSKADAW